MINKIILYSCLLVFSSSCRPKADLVIQDVTIIDVENGSLQPGKSVAVTNGKIISISTDAVAAKQVIDGKGKYLIPGLWDMHTHITMAGEEGLGIFLKCGITSIRDMGGDPGLIKGYIENANRLGNSYPDIYYSGRPLESASFLKRIQQIDTILMSNGVEPLWPTYRYRINPAAIEKPEEVNALLDQMKSQGISFVKYRSLESKEVYEAIASKSKALKLAFGGHFPTQGITLEQASDAGQNSFEHMYAFIDFIGQYDSLKLVALINKLVKNNSYLVPTITTERYRVSSDSILGFQYTELLNGNSDLSSYKTDTALRSFATDWAIRKLEHHVMPHNVSELNRQFDANLQLLKKLKKGGVKIMTGTDQGSLMILPGISLYQELENFVMFLDMSPAEALKSATFYPAEFFGLLKEHGTIDVGKKADLIVLDQNPLEDIKSIRKVNLVIKNGVVSKI